MIRILILGIICFSPKVFADPNWALLLGYEARFEETASGNEREIRSHFRIGSQLQWALWRWQSELGYNSESSGEGFVSIESKTYDWFNWAHYFLNPGNEFRFYAGAGLGLTMYQVTTQVSQVSRTDWSDVHFDVGVLGGLERSFNPKVDGGVELRVYKTEQKKDPIISGLLRIAVKF